MADDDTPTCHGCGRPNPIPDRVCEPCRQRAAERLSAIPALRDQLPLAQVPGGTPVNAGGTHGKRDAAPLPLRLGPFNLLAAGTAHPDDPTVQEGTPPLQVWMDRWAGSFYDRYPSGPIRVPVPAGRPGVPASAALMRRLLTANGKLAKPRRIAVDTVGVAELRASPVQPITDTLDAEHAARYGRDDTRRFAANVAWLACRLDAACDEHPDIAAFLLELRIVVDACRSAVGEHTDTTYLGRCPEVRRRDGEMVEHCGGALWQDPYATLVVCPRCRTATHEKYWLQLAERIAAARPAESWVHELVDPVLVAAGVGPWAPNMWRAGCSCGWTEEVTGGRRDAAGAGRRHLDEVAASEQDARMSA